VDASGNVTRISAKRNRLCSLRSNGIVSCMLGAPGVSLLPTQVSVPGTSFDGKTPVQLAGAGETLVP